MLAPRATAAGVAVLLMGAGSIAAAVAASDGETAPLKPPSEFTALLGCPVYWQAGRVHDVVLGPFGEGNLVRRETRGASYEFPLLVVSDPRFGGTWTVYLGSDEYVYPGADMDDLIRVISATQRIETDGGTWHGSDHDAYVPGAPLSTWDLVTLEGEGGYAGHTALIWTNQTDPECDCSESDTPCVWEVRGVVVAGELPPIPEATG